jgi:hypothetical protein
LILTTAVLLVLKATVLDRAGWLHYTSPSDAARPACYVQQADFSGEIGLLGFDVAPRQLKPGDRVAVTLYWNAQRPLTETYQSFVHLVYPEGKIWTQSDHINPAGFPTNLWPIDRYVQDKHYLLLPRDIPAGQYSLSVGLYTLANGQRLDVNDKRGIITDNVILSQPIIVK